MTTRSVPAGPTPSDPRPADKAANLPRRAYAGIVSRLSALAIDVGLLTLAVAIVRLLPGAIWREIVNRNEPPWLSTIAGVAATLLPWAYFTGSWWLANQTIGSMVLGIEVGRPDGGELSLLHAGLRAVVGLLLFPVWLVGMLATLWDPQRRAWHDRLLRTVVRYTPRTRSSSSTVD